MTRSTPRKTRATGRPTLEEVARLAGVSTITASRALRGLASVGPEYVARVKAAAQELSYVANPAARALASARSDDVAVLIPSLSNNVFTDALEAIHAVLRPRGFEILIGNSHYSRDAEEDLIRHYLASPPQGMIVTGFDRTEAARRLIDASGVPCVHMMELASAEGVYCVGFSQTQAGAAVAEHLIARGCRHNAFVAAQLDVRMLQRGEGFRQVLQRKGLYDAELDVLTPVPSSIRLGGELFMQLIRRRPDIDGIFFGNDDLAQGALYEACRQGIRVPEQVAIVGFNDLAGSADSVPRLTTVRTPRAQMGRTAAQLLLALIDSEPIPRRSIDLGFELIVRESA
ncbi:LacI family DNA-binding transcriptional regulator [Trinickia caryophylli]|uniref:Transcriptional regulator, LacI family n=1 Tax=Trinickia caryophylli TaxID=28094 RepID=A0A1X7CDZ6_TRICW|nr:LacI family DNA-binding transcriptional regulator [Trinickia caryophylli]PMS12570.1 LacI family DNA-binding transcriptional regulator [Trinickia caryophylli]TRX19775.1 substrate-binding domain-containing protein [Trinickia caryophylli]WQE12902.1 LacI family DNA-binding transcriptional regulator [Trinickia caryophylli]SME95008.1 transcriptional regulator, LacI family [Trinickia caryophylli]